VLAAVAGGTVVRDTIREFPDPIAVVGTVMAWIAVWLGCLVVAGIGAAIRAAAWTLEAVRRP